VKRRIFSKIIGGLAALLFLLVPNGAAAEELTGIGARAYMLMESTTGRPLAEKNAQEQLPMASTTKIMTAILAIEEGDPNEVVTVSKECQGIEGTSIYLRAGETLTMQELVYGLMLASGNDAACAIAHHLGGSIEGFAEMMNCKAKEIGAKNTNFVTPHGLPCEGHYTTAEDLARIACYAMNLEEFRKIVSTRNLDLPADEDSPARYLRNKNKLLSQYEGGNGIKTGYTDAAGKCLVGGAERSGMQLVSVVLNDRQMFPDSMALLDYGFDKYSMVQIVTNGELLGQIGIENGVENTVEFAVNEDICLPLRADEGNMIEKKINITTDKLAAPIAENTTVGTLEVYLYGEKIKEIPLYTVKGVEELSLWEKLKKKFRGWFD